VGSPIESVSQHDLEWAYDRGVVGDEDIERLLRASDIEIVGAVHPSLLSGDGWGDGCGDSWGYGCGDGWGYGWGDGWGDGWGYGCGDGLGSGRSYGWGDGGIGGVDDCGPWPDRARESRNGIGEFDNRLEVCAAIRKEPDDE